MLLLDLEVSNSQDMVVMEVRMNIILKLTKNNFLSSTGKEGLFEYIKPKWQKNIRVTDADVDLKKFGASYTADGPGINGGNGKYSSLIG